MDLITSATAEMALWEIFAQSRGANATVFLATVIAVWIAARFSSVLIEKGVNTMGKIICTAFAVSVFLLGLNLGGWVNGTYEGHAAALAALDVANGSVDIGNGSKNFITHGKSGDVAVVIARTGEKGDYHGMTAFILEKGMLGFTSGKKEDKLGMRASETAEIIFDNCRISDDQRLGELGEGFIQSMKILDGGRISIGALSLGIAKGAYEAALKYSKEREQFGKPISSFQGISFKLADMATEIEAAEFLLHKAAYLKNEGRKMTVHSAMSKMYASELCVRVANEAIQIHGGYGYTKDYPVEKFYRDAKLCTIGEGTTEIQKVVIAKNILKD